MCALFLLAALAAAQIVTVTVTTTIFESPSTDLTALPSTDSTVSTASIAPSPTTPPLNGTATHVGAQSGPTTCDLALANACPACNEQYVTDTFGKTYQILCDTHLVANQTYYPQRWLTPAGCIAMCTDYAWCTGATFSLPGDCALSRRSNVTAVLDPSFTAFLPYSTLTTSAPGIASSYPLTATGPKETPTPAPGNASCVLGGITCPKCNNTTVTDALQQRYKVLCGYTPVCADLIRLDNSTQEHCLESCDADVTCMAVGWSADECMLCQRTYMNPSPLTPDSIMFLAEPPFDE